MRTLLVTSISHKYLTLGIHNIDRRYESSEKRPSGLYLLIQRMIQILRCDHNGLDHLINYLILEFWSKGMILNPLKGDLRVSTFSFCEVFKIMRCKRFLLHPSLKFWDVIIFWLRPSLRYMERFKYSKMILWVLTLLKISIFQKGTIQSLPFGFF